jgi:lysophospholipase L1-like esterase
MTVLLRGARSAAARHGLLVGGAAAAAAAVAAAAAAAAASSSACAAREASGLLGARPTIILFGDSITQHSFEDGGWGGAVADLFARRSDVLNRGFGGYNTRWARHLLPSMFPDNCQQHLLVTCWFGANDAAAPGEKAHVPLEEFAENLRHILKRLCKVSKHVIVITPPPVHGPTRLAFQRQKYGDRASGILERTTEQAEQYSAAVRRVAAECGVPVLDVHQLMRADPGWPRFVGGPGAHDLGDGLHLSREGQQFVGRKLNELICEVMGVGPLLTAASSQERIAVEVPSLPIELPAGVRMDPVHFEQCIAEHRAKYSNS